MQKSGLAGELLKIKDRYECLVKLIEKMESAMYTIKEAVQAIQELDKVNFFELLGQFFFVFRSIKTCPNNYFYLQKC